MMMLIWVKFAEIVKKGEAIKDGIRKGRLLVCPI